MQRYLNKLALSCRGSKVNASGRAKKVLGERLVSPKRAKSTMVAAIEEDDLKHVPFGEMGKGVYSDATKGCFLVFDRMSADVMQAVQKSLVQRREAGLAEQTPYRVADFGTADAGTSLKLMHSICSAVREAEPNTPTEILYEDQSINDWTSVFHRVQGVIPTEGLAGKASLSETYGDVYAMASGTSFYSQIAPSGSVDVSFSSTAMHWLTTSPSTITDALHSAYTSDVAVKSLYEERALEDFKRILSKRSSELRKGGYLVLANFSTDEAGQFLGNTHRLPNSMHHQFADIWASIVTPEMFVNTNFPNQYRTKEEHLDPFRQADGDFSGLRVVSYENDQVNCPFQSKFKNGEYEGILSNKEYADQYILTTRTWSNSTFVAGAVNGGATLEEANALTDEMFRQYSDRVAEDPINHGMDYVHGYMTFQKV